MRDLVEETEVCTEDVSDCKDGQYCHKRCQLRDCLLYTSANNEKKDNPSDLVIPEEELKEKEELPVVEENPQANPEEQEADLEKVESDEHEEIVENTEKIDKSEEQEELATKTDQAEKLVKEAPQPSKSLERDVYKRQLVSPQHQCL